MRYELLFIFITITYFRGQCFSDALINVAVNRLAAIAGKYTQIYYYKFLYRGNFTNFKFNQNGQNVDEIKRLGQSIVEHCDDLQYIFTSKSYPRINYLDEKSGKMVESLTSIIAEFAKSG